MNDDFDYAEPDPSPLTSGVITVPLAVDFGRHLVTYDHGVGPEGEGGRRITVEELVIREMARQLLNNRTVRYEVESAINTHIAEAVKAWVEATLATSEWRRNSEVLTFDEMVAQAVKSHLQTVSSTWQNGREKRESLIETLVGSTVQKELAKVASEAVNAVRKQATEEAAAIAGKALAEAVAKLVP